MTVKKLIEQSQEKVKADVYTLLAADADVKDIESASYDIALYALHKFTKDDDMRKFRLYIEGKIKQYVDSCICS